MFALFLIMPSWLERPSKLIVRIWPRGTTIIKLTRDGINDGNQVFLLLIEVFGRGCSGTLVKPGRDLINCLLDLSWLRLVSAGIDMELLESGIDSPLPCHVRSAYRPTRSRQCP